MYTVVDETVVATSWVENKMTWRHINYYRYPAQGAQVERQHLVITVGWRSHPFQLNCCKWKKRPKTTFSGQKEPTTSSINLQGKPGSVSWSLGLTGNSWFLEISQGGKQPYTLECWPKRWDGAPLACTQAGWFGEMVWVVWVVWVDGPNGGRTAGFLYNFFFDISISFWHWCEWMCFFFSKRNIEDY